MKSFLNRWRARPTPAAVPALAFELGLALYTDVGPVREHNEDCIAALDAPRTGQQGERLTLVALADGMGGHQAGELASHLAVRAALRAFGGASHGGAAGVSSNDAARIDGDSSSGPGERLHAALAAANLAVYQQAQRGPQWQGMGTTLLLFAPTAHGAFFAWVGDSRLYLLREGELTTLTRDDTLVRGLLERGLIDAVDIARHPDHSVLTQAVGTHATIPSPHVQGPLALRLGDRFLLCSDGVHDVVPTPQLASALQATTPHAALRDIHQMALRNGADDNLSIGIVDILRPRPAQSEPVAERRTHDHIEVPS